MNSIYPLRNIRYFNAYNSQTKQLEFSKYNFNFDLYKSEFGLEDKTKLEIFDDFILRNGSNYKIPTVVKEELKQYFLPMTQKIQNYNRYIGMSIHPGYINIFNLNSYIPYEVLVENQFDTVFYTNNQIRRLQDYYYNDIDNNIYSKYNFNFDLYSQDFNVYGNKLVIFTDFISRVIYESDTLLGTNGYGDPKSFSKYFIQDPTLNEYLVNHGNFSIFYHTKKSIHNIDWENYAELSGYVGQSKDILEENYIINGQFVRYPIKFLQEPLDEFSEFSKSLAIVSGNQISTSSTGVGFLYKNINKPNNIYLITNDHILSSDNLESFFGIFEIVNNSNKTISTTAEFKVIGRDKFTDILIGLFDPELFYNKTFNVDLSDYKPIDVNLNLNIKKNDVITVIGSIGSIDNRTAIEGRIMDPKYNGTFTDNSYSIPECYLMDINVDNGLSGSPVLIKESDKFNLVGLLVCRIGTNYNYAVAINNFTLKTVISSLLENYDVIKLNFKDEYLKFSILTQKGLTKKWLGIFGYYNDPINIRSKNSSLINLKYNGGLVITKFILGFDYVEKKFIYETDSLVKASVIPIDGPLLNSRMYSRFIESNKNPIVIKSMTFYDAIRCQYFKFNIGKYSNQDGFFRFNYGFLPLGNFNIILNNFISKLGFTYGKVLFEYYYYNANVWVLESEYIGGNDETWYNKYELNTLSKFIQHKYEYPIFLLPYTSSFANTLFINLNKGTLSFSGDPSPSLKQRNPLPISYSGNPLPISYSGNPQPISYFGNPQPISFSGNPLPISYSEDMDMLY